MIIGDASFTGPTTCRSGKAKPSLGNKVISAGFFLSQIQCEVAEDQIRASAFDRA